MQINDLTPSACRWILLSCCLTPPFFHSACAQNVNGETTAQTEIAVKQGFVPGLPSQPQREGIYLCSKSVDCS